MAIVWRTVAEIRDIAGIKVMQYKVMNIAHGLTLRATVGRSSGFRHVNQCRIVVAIEL